MLRGCLQGKIVVGFALTTLSAGRFQLVEAFLSQAEDDGVLVQLNSRKPGHSIARRAGRLTGKDKQHWQSEVGWH